jgi:flagellar biosynthesis/type III secretory pathway protein FliH
VLTQNDGERYAARVKARRDLTSAQKEIRLQEFEQGFQEGFERGFKEGLQQGMLFERVRLCQRLLKQAQTPFEELEKTPLEDLARLAGDLEKQALPPEA